jgi:2,3-dihydroxyphenylpropionate 1,2-dioxygenase
LLFINEPSAETKERVHAAFDSARRFIAEFDPELVVLFAPDHYNSFLYDMMPPFCIGGAATAIGDYRSLAGPLAVDHEAAMYLAEAVLASDIDVAVSEEMSVDHAFAQPLDIFFGSLDRIPVVPVFINSVAEPLGPPRRARRLGAAIGSAALAMDRRVLFVGSGGLSHDPPFPTLATASEEVRQLLIKGGRMLAPEDREIRQARVIQAGLDYDAGLATSMLPLNPTWDRFVLSVLASGDLNSIDSWTTHWCTENGGHSSHEVRTWIASYAALAAAGPYTVKDSFYEAIPIWVAGFAITAAHSNVGARPTLPSRRG